MTEPTAAADHLLVRTRDSGHESAFECLDGCGRHVVVRHDPPALVVLDHGDLAAGHHWSDLGVTFSASVDQR
jgi:hypothetical protein